MTPTHLRTIRINDEDWQRLNDVASRVVPDEAMPTNAPASYGRVAQMLRMIASGELVVREGAEHGNRSRSHAIDGGCNTGN